MEFGTLPESDSFNVSEHPSAFSLKLLRDRLFNMSKLTPAHMPSLINPDVDNNSLGKEDLIPTPSSSGVTNADTVFNQNGFASPDLSLHSAVEPRSVACGVSGVSRIYFLCLVGYL